MKNLNMMNKIKESKSIINGLGYKRILKYTEILLSIFLYICVLLSVFQISIFDIVKYFVFQICGIFVPGFFLSGLYKNRISPIGRFCLSYAMGYAFNIIEYFLTELLDRKIPYVLFSILVFAVSVVVIWKNREDYTRLLKKDENDTDGILLIFVLSCLLFLNIFVYAVTYKDIFNIPHDLSWWINNSVSLKINFPPDNLFMSGTKLYYHYFSSMQIAYTSLVTGIDITTLSIPLYVIPKTIVILGAVIFFMEIMDIKGWEMFFGITIILFTTGIEQDSIVTYFHHILVEPFGFDVGFAFGIYFVSFLIVQWKYQKFNWRNLILTIFAWTVCVGAKAPIAAVLLLFPGLICFYWLIKKKWLLSLSYGIPILGMFVLISVGCVGMLSVANGDSGSYYLSLHSIRDLRIFAGEEKNIFVAFIERWIVMNPTIFFLIVFSIIDFSIYKKIYKKVNEKDIIILIAIATYIWGIALWRVILADGSSEMYYGMAAYIPAYIFIAYIFNCYNSIEKNQYKYGIENGMKIALCLLGLYFFMFNPYGGVGAVEYTQNAIQNTKTISAVNLHGMDGLIWLRDNTDKDAIIVSDSAVMTRNDEYYFYGIISERQQYIEGTHMLRFGNQKMQKEIDRRKMIVQSMYNNDAVALEILKDEGVSYIVQTKDITPDFICDNRIAELIAFSDNINIYRIR